MGFRTESNDTKIDKIEKIELKKTTKKPLVEDSTSVELVDPFRDLLWDILSKRGAFNLCFLAVLKNPQ